MADDQGHFQFPDLQPGPALTYQLEVVFQGVSYDSEQITLEPGQAAEVNLNVYDTTTSDAAISLDSQVVLVDIQRGSLAVWTSYYWHNGGHTTYIGSEGETALYPLPSGSYNLTLIRGLEPAMARVTPEGLSDATPLPPGQREVIFLYNVDYSGRRYRLPLHIPYATQRLEVLVEDIGVGVSSPQMTMDPQPISIGQLRFLRLWAGEVSPGTTLEVKLTGLPSPAGGGSYQPALRWLGVGGAALAVAFALLYPSLRRRPRPVPGSPLREALLAEVAALDDAFQAGTLPEADYRERRARAIAWLAEETPEPH